MSRREFTRAIKVAAFRRCGGRCEAVESNGERCSVMLQPGRWQCDHVVADAHGGKPALENAACLCLAHHAEKTKGDTTIAAKLKRNEAAHIGAKAPVSHKLQSRNTFSRSTKRQEHPVKMLGPKVLYVGSEA